MNLDFKYHMYFYIFIIVFIFIIFFYFFSFKKNNFGPINDLEKVFRKNSKIYLFYYIIIGFIFLFYFIIFAKPIHLLDLKPTNKNGIDIQIVLDVSFSMTAKDMNPDRLTVAKDVINNFIDNVSGDRIGIIIFAGKTFTSLPLNFDYNIIKKIVSKITVNTINQNFRNMQGTAIGDALILATNSFYIDDRKKVIIFLTDGSANRGINPELALKYLKSTKKNIKVYTIGIGGYKETFVQVKNLLGGIDNINIGAVDEKILKQISDYTNGKYFRATNKTMLNDIFKTIEKIEKNNLKHSITKYEKPKYDNFIYILIVLFLLLVIIRFYKKL